MLKQVLVGPSLTPAMFAEHPAEDPLHDDFCILDSLRLRHRVRSNIRQGSASQLEIQRPAGLASLRRNQHASLDESGECLVIRDLTTGALLHSWPLRVQHVHSYSWTWGSQVLAMTSSTDAFQESVLLVDCADGRCTLIDGVTLLSSWSSTGLLVVQKWGDDDDHDVNTSDDSDIDITQPLSVVDATGTAVCTVSLGGDTPHVQWSPDGCTALLHFSAHSFWLWDVFAGAVPQFMLTVEPRHFNIRTAAWSD